MKYVKQTVNPYEKDVYITRSQTKAQANATPKESKPEHGSDSDYEKPNDMVVKDPLKGKKSVTFEVRVIPIISHVFPELVQIPTQSIPIVQNNPLPDLAPI